MIPLLVPVGFSWSKPIVLDSIPANLVFYQTSQTEPVPD